MNMKIEILENYKNKNKPVRKLKDDAGINLFFPEKVTITSHPVAIPLGIKVEIPEGHVGFILPRSSAAKVGIETNPVPIDSNYRGEIHAFVRNPEQYKTIEKDVSVVQLVVLKCETMEIEFGTIHSETERGTGAFGSTGDAIS